MLIKTTARDELECK